MNPNDPSKVEFTTKEGEHPGWNRYKFERMGRSWDLLTIDDGKEPSRSLLTPDDVVRNDPWPGYMIQGLVGVLSVPAAVVMIDRFYYAWRIGQEAGYSNAQHDMRKALGILR